jgi:hypothetical protein
LVSGIIHPEVAGGQSLSRCRKAGYRTVPTFAAKRATRPRKT